MEESDCFSLIDENDSLISPDADDYADAALTHLHSEPGEFESIGDIGADRVDDMDLSNKWSEQLPQLVETEQPRKTSKFNLRKSLAWNSAFFESPGFLDAEELSNMIDGADKGKKHLLPGIDEDISRSTESISTLASENMALEGLDDELFKDIRASIQKSSKASSISTSNRKAAPKETGELVKCSVKKAGITSRNVIASNVTSKRQTGGMQGSGRISKKDSSSALVTQPGLRNGNSSSFPQSPKVITKLEAMPVVTTKRAFLSSNRVKTETNNSKGKGVQVHVPTAAGLAGPRRSVPKPASLLKASGSAFSGATIKEVGRSSCSSNVSNSTLTEKIQKSISTSARTKKISNPVIQASSKIPSSKNSTGKSGVPSSLTSSKISSSISPSSSISEWSSASSTSTVNRRLTSRTSIDINSSCRSIDSETPSILCSVQSSDGSSDGILNHFKESPSQDMKKTNAQNNVLSRSVLMKPSGLRMPSPKIGFFDGAKSMVHTPNACRQSQLRLPTGLPKIGTAIHSPVGSSKKAEVNIPSGKKAISISGANKVLNTSKSSKSASPRPSQESSRASMKGHGDSRSVSSPNISSEVRSSNEGTGKPCPEMTFTSTKIELEGHKSGSPKAFQESASPGRSPEKSQSHLLTGLPKIRAAIHSPFGSSKKTEGNIPAGKKATAGANTVLGTLKSDAPKPSQESSIAMKGHGNCRSVLSLDISSEARSSNEETGKAMSKMTLTSANTEIQGQKSDSIKPFQERASVGLSLEQSQSCLPTVLPEIEALICDPVGSSKKEGNMPTGEKAAAFAITVLDTSKSASPIPSQESSRDSRVSMKCHGDTESVSSPNVSPEMRSSNKGTGKPWPEMTLTSTNIELEGQKSGSPKPFQESACPSVCQEQSQLQSPTCLAKIGAAIQSPVGGSEKAEGKIPTEKTTTEGADTILDMTLSATLEPSQESSRALMKSHGDHRSLFNPEISSEAMCSDEVTRKPCTEMTSTNIELEGPKSDTLKPFQVSASFGMSPEHQLCLSIGFPKSGVEIWNPVGSSKKEEKIPAGEKATAGANTVLDTSNTSNSGSPKPSRDSSRDSMKGLADHWKLSPNLSSEARSSNMGSEKPWSEITLTSTIVELEGQKCDFPKPFPESASPVVSQGILIEIDRFNCIKAEDVKIGKGDGAERATTNAPKAENNENMLNI